MDLVAFAAFDKAQVIDTVLNLTIPLAENKQISYITYYITYIDEF